MAQLIPENFDFSSVEGSERRVIRRLLDGLGDSWLVIPSVPITYKGEDREIDVVVVGLDHGALAIEVKGGIVTVEDGQWKSWDSRIKNPARQVKDAKYALLKRLQKAGAADVHISHLVALPDNADFPAEGAGPECPREIVLTKAEFVDIAGTFSRILPARHVEMDQVGRLVKALRPDVSDIQVDGRHVGGTLTRLADATGERLGPVIGLDENLRVYLRGAAGTGKTFVAMRWYRRALMRGERTLYMCFNSPLAGDVATQVSDIAEEMVGAGSVVPEHMVGNFHALMRRMMGAAAPPIPEGDEMAVQEYWNNELSDSFSAHMPRIRERFDTIIIDEAQDFRPEWLGIIEGLMVDRSTSRLYLMADSDQAIYVSSWVPPTGITTLELTHNIRNSGNIARIAARLGGAPVPRSVPPGPSVDFHLVSGNREAIKAVRRSLQHVTGELGVPLSRVAVLVAHRTERDMLTNALAREFAFVKWQDRDEDAVVCETVHRTKGLERQAVVLVNLDEEPDRTIVYIGVSRASAHLAIVGRESLIRMCREDD